ncbi:MAG: hypothetical protein HQL44_02110 [Alphaproteobacteria bacterium]|nr:hypothetical protein [Alphaproteobacteria bacterium]
MTKMWNINTVFGIGQKGDDLHYVERSVDYEFIRNLSRDKHLCIYGSSKQGKTALRKRHISSGEEIVIVCDPEWTANSLIASVLKAANCKIETTSKDVNSGKVGLNAGVGVKVKIPLFGEVAGSFGSGADSGEASEISYESLPVDLSDMAEIVKILKRVFIGKYVVIEEFHYLPEDVQKSFAIKLKALHELSEFLFIIVGVWLEKNRLAHLNRDLTGRVAPINADEWGEDDLLKVIREGELKLNIEFPPGFAEKLVKMACGSVYIVREVCYRACEINNVFNTENSLRKIKKTISIPTLLSEVSRDGADYQAQLISLMGIDGARLHEQEEKEDLLKWVIRSLVFCGHSELRRGIPLNTLRANIQKYHPRQYHPTANQIERILLFIQSAQNKNMMNTLFDYDRQDKVVRCVDKGYILWRENTHIDSIKDFLECA